MMNPVSLHNIAESEKKHKSVFRWDNELEQSIIRILIGIVLAIYIWNSSKHNTASYLQNKNEYISVITVFLLLSVLLTLSILIRPGRVEVRRVFAIFLDVGSLTYVFFLAKEDASPLYFIYLWVIIGYGFRFGKKYLLISLTASLVSFAIVIAYIPFWSVHLNFSIGLWIGMLMISLYSSALVGRLYKALEYAEVANHAKRQFISSVSHELRTPLNSIIGMVELLKSTPLDNEQQEMLECMNTTSHVMLSQVEDVLDFSKIEAGKMAIEETEFDLYALVFSIIDIFRFRVDPKIVEILTVVDCDVPHALRGDPHHLRQIIVNLLGNAVKFTERGRITIRIVRLVTVDGAVSLRFSIKDTGIGIAYDAQSKIFDSFTQADDATTRRYGGTGLGTTICQRLVELMHGRIGFSSEPGTGSEFWFELKFKYDSRSSEVPKFINAQRIRGMIIHLDESYDSRIEKIIEYMDGKIRHTENMGSALSAIEHGNQKRKPYNLIFFVFSPSRYTDLHQYENSLKKYVHAVKTAAMQMPLSLIMVCPNELTKQVADDVVENTGCTSLLINPIEKINLHNILHAHLLLLENSVANKKRGCLMESSVSPANNPVKKQTISNSYHILVAEDNHTNQKVLKKILERVGYRCTLANNGEEALGLIEKIQFDAIILDMNMPVITGLDVARAYCAMRPKSERAPMIMFSANVTTDAKQGSLEAGVDEFLPKPIQIELFMKTLEKLIGQYQTIAFSGQHRSTIFSKKGYKWVHFDEPNLTFHTLQDLENISDDPYFLDELINEFIIENKKIIKRFERAFFCFHYEQIREILHFLKGSAVSVGGRSLLMACRQVEKMTDAELKSHAEEILRVISRTCDVLCEELKRYLQERKSYLVEDVF